MTSDKPAASLTPLRRYSADSPPRRSEAALTASEAVKVHESILERLIDRIASARDVLVLVIGHSPTSEHVDQVPNIKSKAVGRQSFVSAWVRLPRAPNQPQALTPCGHSDM